MQYMFENKGKWLKQINERYSLTWHPGYVKRGFDDKGRQLYGPSDDDRKRASFDDASVYLDDKSNLTINQEPALVEYDNNDNLIAVSAKDREKQNVKAMKTGAKKAKDAIISKQRKSNASEFIKNIQKDIENLKQELDSFDNKPDSFGKQKAIKNKIDRLQNITNSIKRYTGETSSKLARLQANYKKMLTAVDKLPVNSSKRKDFEKALIILNNAINIEKELHK